MDQISFKQSLALKLAFLVSTVGLILGIGWPLPEHPSGVFEEGLPDRAPSAESSGVGYSQPPRDGAAGIYVPKLELNHATLEELQTLPGIGEVLAQRVIAHRRTVGTFRSVDELRDVRGIGAKRMEQLRPLVTVGHPGSAADTDPE